MLNILTVQIFYEEIIEEMEKLLLNENIPSYQKYNLKWDTIKGKKFIEVFILLFRQSNITSIIKRYFLNQLSRKNNML